MFIDSTLTINDSVACYAIIDSLGSIISGDWGINGSFINHDSLHINLPISSPQCYGFWYNGKKISSSNILTETLENKSLIIYPNPVINTIYFSLQQNTNSLFLLLTDLQGRIIKTGLIKGLQDKMDVSELPQGMYLLKAGNEQGVVSKKIIIQH
jgi:hypothetical protein